MTNPPSLTPTIPLSALSSIVLWDATASCDEGSALHQSNDLGGGWLGRGRLLVLIMLGIVGLGAEIQALPYLWRTSAEEIK
jgi:hypothetical protein